MSRRAGWTHWNVALWIANDEGLYRMARYYMRRGPTKWEAARQMKYALADLGHTETPDGATYSAASILAAMRGLE